MNKIIPFSSNDNRFLLEDCQFTPPPNVHFINNAGNPFLMGVSRARLFDGNVLYYCLMAKKKLKKVANNSLVQSLEKRRNNEQKLLKPKIFNFNSRVNKLHQLIETFPDSRTGKNINKNKSINIKEKYKIIRNRHPTKKTFFEDIRALTCYICFGNWNHLMIFIRCGFWIETKIPIEADKK